MQVKDEVTDRLGGLAGWAAPVVDSYCPCRCRCTCPHASTTHVRAACAAGQLQALGQELAAANDRHERCASDLARVQVGRGVRPETPWKMQARVRI